MFYPILSVRGRTSSKSSDEIDIYTPSGKPRSLLMFQKPSSHRSPQVGLPRRLWTGSQFFHLVIIIKGGKYRRRKLHPISISWLSERKSKKPNRSILTASSAWLISSITTTSNPSSNNLCILHDEWHVAGYQFYESQFVTWIGQRTWHSISHNTSFHPMRTEERERHLHRALTSSTRVCWDTSLWHPCLFQKEWIGDCEDRRSLVWDIR